MPDTPNLLINHWQAGQSQPEVTVNDAFDDLEGALTQDVSLAAPITLTTPQALRNLVFTFSGTGNVVVPDQRKLYVVKSSAGSLTVKTAANPGVAISDTDWHVLYCTGTDVIEVATGGGGGITTIAAATDTNIVAPSAGQILEWDGVSAWANVTPAAAPSQTYDIGFFFSGTPAVNSEVLRMKAVRGFTLTLTTDVSRGSVGTNPSSPTTFSIKRDGSEVGTFAVSTGGLFTFTGTSQAWTAGQVLTVVAPAGLNALADLGVVLLGVQS